jgi:hypothetical protein
VRDVRAPDGRAEAGEEVHRPRRHRDLPARGRPGPDQGRDRIEVIRRPRHTVTTGRTSRALTTEAELLPGLLDAGDDLPPDERAAVLRRTG